MHNRGKPRKLRKLKELPRCNSGAEPVREKNSLECSRAPFLHAWLCEKPPAELYSHKQQGLAADLWRRLPYETGISLYFQQAGWLAS